MDVEAEVEGAEATEPAEEFADESALALLAVLLLWLAMLPEVELLLREAVELWLVEGVVEAVLPPVEEPEEFSVFAPLALVELAEVLLLFAELLNDVLLFVVSLVLALPLIEPDAEPAAFRL